MVRKALLFFLGCTQSKLSRQVLSKRSNRQTSPPYSKIMWETVIWFFIRITLWVQLDRKNFTNSLPSTLGTTARLLLMLTFRDQFQWHCSLECQIHSLSYPNPKKQNPKIIQPRMQSCCLSKAFGTWLLAWFVYSHHSSLLCTDSHPKSQRTCLPLQSWRLGLIHRFQAKIIIREFRPSSVAPICNVSADPVYKPHKKSKVFLPRFASISAITFIFTNYVVTPWISIIKFVKRCTRWTCAKCPAPTVFHSSSLKCHRTDLERFQSSSPSVCKPNSRKHDKTRDYLFGSNNYCIQRVVLGSRTQRTTERLKIRIPK